MAAVSLKGIMKIYPNAEKKKAKKGQPEKKTNLRVTEEGILAVDNFCLEIADKVHRCRQDFRCYRRCYRSSSPFRLFLCHRLQSAC